MARSYRKGIVKQSSSLSTTMYNRKVREYNNQKLRNAFANDLLGNECVEFFETKNVYNDYDYCDSRDIMTDVKYTRK